MRKSFLSFLIFIFLIFLFGLRANAQSQSIEGYYNDNNGTESIANIPWADYTQVVLFQTQAGANGSGVGNGSVDTHYLVLTDIPAFVAAAHAAGKKALFCIKYNNDFSDAFTQDTAPGMVSTFAANITNFTTSNGFDGVVLDWENGVVASQYEALIDALHTAMPTKIINMTGWQDSCCGSNLINTAVAKSSTLNQVEVMCYDLDLGEGRTEYNDPLMQAGNSGMRACDWAVAAYTNAGVPKAKISVGIPFYGRRWPGSTRVLQTTAVTPSTFFYRDLVTDTTRWQPQYRFYDSTYKSDYLSIPSPPEFDSFTGPTAIAAIVAWGKAQGFVGFMAFTIDYEYVSSASGNARYPLSTALYNEVLGGVSPPTGLRVVIQ
jgi:chitinase